MSFLVGLADRLPKQIGWVGNPSTRIPYESWHINPFACAIIYQRTKK